MARDATLESVRVLTHSAIRLQSSNGVVIYFDPYDLTDAQSLHDADAVLLTHTHYDHLSPEDIARVSNESTIIIAPTSAIDEVAKAGLQVAIPMDAGDACEVRGIAIMAVPAYNVEPERLGFHPKENGWLGYLATMDDKTYYIAGDTDQNPDNEKVRCDVALIPIGGTYTMDAKQAAAFANTIKPGFVVPTHYGTAVGVKEAADEFEPLVDPSIAVIRKMEWRENA